MNTSLVVSYEEIDRSLRPIFMDDPVILVFKLSVDDRPAAITSPEYNLGVQAWPTEEWITRNLAHFFENYVVPAGHYNTTKEAALYRVYSDREYKARGEAYTGTLIKKCAFPNV